MANVDFSACHSPAPLVKMNKRRREDGTRAASPGPGAQERPAVYHGVKAENDAFRAFIVHKNQTVDIGLFSTADDAARAHDRKVRIAGWVIPTRLVREIRDGIALYRTFWPWRYVWCMIWDEVRRLFAP